MNTVDAKRYAAIWKLADQLGFPFRVAEIIYDRKNK